MLYPGRMPNTIPSKVTVMCKSFASHKILESQLLSLKAQSISQPSLP